MNMKIYILGNELVEEDSLPLRILGNLRKDFKKIEFIELDSTEGLPEEEELIIIDSVINTDKIVIYTEKDIDKFMSSPNYSVHDFDLASSLKIAKKLGRLKKFKIIGLPSGMNEDIALKELKGIINDIKNGIC